MLNVVENFTKDPCGYSMNVKVHALNEQVTCVGLGDFFYILNKFKECM